MSPTSTVKWMFHATAMGPSYDGLLEPLARHFGCRVLHCNDAPTPGIERRGGMTWIADNSIEIGQPLGDSSPVHRFLERFGGGLHSVAVQVEDVDAALAQAEGAGVRVANRPHPGLAFTSPADTCGLLFEWNANPQLDDPRSGAALPEPAEAPSTVEPREMAFVAAVVADPAMAAAHLAETLGTSFHLLGKESPGQPDAVVGVGDCVLALHPLPTSADEAEAIWGMPLDRARFVALGLTVDDVDAAAAAMAQAGVPTHRRRDDDQRAARRGPAVPGGAHRRSPPRRPEDDLGVAPIHVHQD